MNNERQSIDDAGFAEDLFVVFDFFYGCMDWLKDRVEAIFEKCGLSTAAIRILAYLYCKNVDSLHMITGREEVMLSKEEYDHGWKEIFEYGLGYGGEDFENYINRWAVEKYKVEEESVCSDPIVERSDFISLVTRCYEMISDNNVEKGVEMMDAAASAYPEFESCRNYLELVSEEGLNVADKSALIYAAGRFIRDGNIPFNEVTENEIFEKYDDERSDADGIARLVTKGLLSSVQVSSCETDDKKIGYVLSHKSCRALFSGFCELIRYDAICRQSDVIKCGKIRKKELFYDPDNAERVEEIKEIVSVGKFQQIQDRLRERGKKCGIACLLYGAPGTGKTELVRQAAKTSGRDIVIADVSKLYGMYVGEGEKNFRELFRNIRYLQILSARAPIVLLDEADGILGKRMTATRANEKSENAIQSILLQELETFEGILIATTNLADNIDPAFERRFIFKMEFRKPSAEVRARIWKGYMPELTDDDASELAGRYDLSGGQIDNVVRKCEIRYVLKGDWPEIAEIKNFCSQEVSPSIDVARPPRVMGFARYSKNY